MFSVTIDFNVQNNTSAFFTVVGNGNNYGSFAFTDLPITIGPLFGDAETQYEFLIYDNDNLDCQAVYELGVVDCGPFCGFDDAVLEFVTCQSNISAIVLLDFNYFNVSGQAFDLFNANGQPIGSWLYESLPVTLPNFLVNGNDPIVLQVCDDNSEICCQTFEFPPIDCNPNNCEIFGLSAIPTCDGSNFTVEINFQVANPASDSFKIMGNGINYGNFSYSDLPVTLGPLNGSGNINWEFGIQDLENTNCSNAIELGQVECPGPCSITSITAEATECTSDSTYTVIVNATAENPSEQGFTLFTQGQVIGQYSYDTLPLTIPDFPVSGNFFDVITICDNGDAACCATVEFQSLQCGGCLIYDLNYDLIPCNAENEFFVELDFLFQNPGNGGFQVGGNGNIYGTYSYEDLPVTIGPLSADGSTFYEFVVLDLDNGGCLDIAEIGQVECADICGLLDLSVSELECSGDNLYSMIVNFVPSAGSGQGFNLFANGVLFGTYSYEVLPLVIDHFPASGNLAEVIEVCDNEDPECCSIIEFEAIDCDLPCEITELIAEPIECTSDSTFAVDIDFNFANTEGNGFNLYAGDLFLGQFEKGEGAINIDLFPSVQEGLNQLTVCSNNDSLCCTSIEFEGLNCFPEPCAITGLELLEQGCTSDTTITAAINFSFENTLSNLFDVFDGDDTIGFFEKGEGPLVLEGLLLNGDTTKTITVCANDLPDCCMSITFEVPDCTPGPCAITGLEIVEQICTSDSTIDVAVNFQHENTGSDIFDVFDGDLFVGFYEKGEGPLLIEGLLLGGNNEKFLTICANDMPDCCETIAFETPICLPDTCILEIVSIFPVECLSDSTFRVNMTIQSEGLSSDFDVFHFGDFIGTFEANENGQFSIPNFPSTGSQVNQVIVCAASQEACCDTADFEGLICDPDLCIIDDIIVDATECTSDSAFTAIVQFLYQNTPSDTFDIFSVDGYFGSYVKGEDPLELTGFPANTNGNYVVTICAQDIEGCCATEEFEGPICTDECTIFNVVAEPIECESTTSFIVEVDFDFLNLAGSGVDIYAGETYLGFYEVENLPLQVFGFPVPATEFSEITICQSDDTLCCTTIQFEPLNCAELFCDIFDLTYDLSDCDTLQNFMVTLDFGFVNTSEGGFNLVGNGVNYGNFSYEAVPLTIGPLPADPLIAYEFLVQDLEDNTCFDFVDVGVVSCETTSTGYEPRIMDIQLMYQDNMPYLLVPEPGLELRLYSTGGKLVYAEQGMDPGGWHPVRASSLPEGIYFLQLFNDRSMYTGKVLIAK